MYGKFKEFLTQELANIEAAGLYKKERIITTPQRADIQVNAGEHVLNFCANNYLGLSDNKRLIEAAKSAMITGDIEDDGLGFDYKWNMGWMNDFIGYMKNDPLYRGSHHGELTFSMIYAYSEKFMLSFSHDEVVHGKGSLLNKMPGEPKLKFANLRAAYAFMMAHPGKKLLFMGQDFAQPEEWSEQNGLHWDLLQQPEHKQMQEYMKELITFYKTQPALYDKDFVPEGFEWINFTDWEKNVVSFLRKARKSEEMLLVVCNFSDVVYEDYQVGVPYAGKYKEIFNSDSKNFGGDGVTNPRVKMAKKQECDERKYSIRIKVPALGVSIFNFTKEVAKQSGNKAAKKKSTAQTKTKKNLKQELEKKIAEEEK